MEALGYMIIPNRLFPSFAFSPFTSHARATNRYMDHFQGEAPDFFFITWAFVHTFTRLAIQWIVEGEFKLLSFQLEYLMGNLLLCFVTTSPMKDRITSAPAAFIGGNSRFSGPCPESKPKSPLPVDTMVDQYSTIES